MLRDFLAVGAGGFLGATLRYGVTLGLARFAFPVATLAVNVVGSFALGWLAGVLERGEPGSGWRPFLSIGLLGALTTFSTFSLEVVHFMKNGEWSKAALTIGLNVVLAVGAAWLGLSVAGAADGR